MPSSSHDNVTQSLRASQASQPTTEPLSSSGAQPTLEHVPVSSMLPATSEVVTGSLMYVDTDTTTRKLTLQRTASRLPTVIPATEKRARVPAPSPVQRRRRRGTLMGILASCLGIIVALALFITPLANGSSHSVLQSLGSFIDQGSTLANFHPPAQAATPTPTPDLMTGEGYCGGTDIWGTCATAVTASGVMGTGVMQKPIIGAVITQAFAHPEYQTWCGCIRPHSGIDLAAPYGTPITAADSGQVIWVGWDWSGLGWAVKINHGHYIATIYGHMDHYIVKRGQNVTKGQIIGYEGTTGASTGPHVHFMVMVNNIWVDPTLYVALP